MVYNFVMEKIASVDGYIALQSEIVKPILKKIRKIILDADKNIQEGIYYGMAGYKLAGPLVYFAANKKHIGFYPTPRGVEAFKKDLAGYKTSKGAIQFPLDKPIPYDLIEKIVKFRVKEN